MRLDSLKRASCALAVLCSLAMATSGVQDLRSQHVGDGGPLPPAAISVDHMLTTSDLAYGLVVLFSLLQVEPIEQVDEWTSRELVSGFGHADTWPRWGGRELGAGRGSLALAAAPLVYGLLASDSRARNLGLESLSSLYTAAFLTRVLKMGVGRARPGRSSDPDAFAPFNGDAAFHSFPSGHTARVFAVAATIARELGENAPWVPYVAYSIATWSAATRVMDRAHWLTDIGAGASVGIFASGLVDRLNRSCGGDGWALDIHPLPDGGVALGVNLPAP